MRDDFFDNVGIDIHLNTFARDVVGCVDDYTENLSLEFLQNFNIVITGCNKVLIRMFTLN